MRVVQESNLYRKNLKRLGRGKYRNIINDELPRIIDVLKNDGTLDTSYRDHPLIGSMKDRRECHLAFDLVLIYKMIGDDILYLSNIGSHSEALGL